MFPRPSFSRLLLASLFALPLALPAWAEEAPKPDDSIEFNISADDWVATKTAHVTLDAEAAVSAANAGSMRAEMMKAVNDAAKAEWRMTGFTRTQDQTGLERWSVTFDARLPESELNGLAEATKKASKAGMQISVADIDFAPTIDETEAVEAGLRAHILKEAQDQLAAINAAMPGHNYRVAHVFFNNAMPMFAPGRKVMALAMAAPAPEAAAPDHAQKIVMNARIELAAPAPAASREK